MKEVEPLWLERLEGALTELKTIPLWGQVPSFPWELLSEKLESEFELKNVILTPHQTRFLKREELLSGLGKDPHILPLALAPLSEHAFWALSRDTLAKIGALFTSMEMRASALSEGFYLFLALKVANLLNEEQALGDLELHLSDQGHFPEEGALCLDIEISIEKHKFWARLITSQKLQRELIDHFASEKLTVEKLSPNLPLLLHIELGGTTLEMSEWKAVSVGDLLLLDRCSFDPLHQKGTATLTLGSTPLFQLRLKEGEIKILDHAFYQEESYMPHKKHTEENEESPSEDRPLWSTPNGENEAVGKILSSSQIPLTLTVEVARLTLPLEKVMHLKPGNLLDLNIGPAPTVHLTVGGRPVARGELVKIGDSVGVKILGLGE